jgi:hypothetical protein
MAYLPQVRIYTRGTGPTGGTFTAGVNDSSGKFANSVVDTGAALIIYLQGLRGR